MEVNYELNLLKKKNLPSTVYCNTRTSIQGI